MANKGNAALAIDREAIAKFHELSVGLNQRLDEVRTEANPLIKYLTDEENISGSDSDSFKASMDALSGILNEVKTKVDTIAITVGSLSQTLGNVAKVNEKTLGELKNDMGKTIAAMKQKGK